jgi:hypothetical protein
MVVFNRVVQNGTPTADIKATVSACKPSLFELGEMGTIIAEQVRYVSCPIKTAVLPERAAPQLHVVTRVGGSPHALVDRSILIGTKCLCGKWKVESLFRLNPPLWASLSMGMLRLPHKARAPRPNSDKCVLKPDIQVCQSPELH